MNPRNTSPDPQRVPLYQWHYTGDRKRSRPGGGGSEPGGGGSRRWSENPENAERSQRGILPRLIREGRKCHFYIGMTLFDQRGHFVAPQSAVWTISGRSQKQVIRAGRCRQACAGFKIHDWVIPNAPLKLHNTISFPILVIFCQDGVDQDFGF